MTQIAASARPESSVIAWIRRHPVPVLFFLIYLFEWIYLVPALFDELGMLPFHIPGIFAWLSGWAPGLAAIIVAGALQGTTGIKNLFRRYLIWRVGIGWYLFALFGTAAFILGGIGLHVLLGGTAPTLPISTGSPIDTLIVFPIFVAFGFFGNLEDIAWRGVALPLLQAKHSALRASLIIGVFEALTHLPFFFVPGDFRQQTGIWFIVFSVAIVILMTWMYNNTRGSLLLVVLYHATQNTWANLLDTTPSPGPNDLRPFILAVALMVAAAIAVVVRYGPERLSHKPASELPSL